MMIPVPESDLVHQIKGSAAAGDGREGRGQEGLLGALLQQGRKGEGERGSPADGLEVTLLFLLG